MGGGEGDELDVAWTGPSGEKISKGEKEITPEREGMAYSEEKRERG